MSTTETTYRIAFAGLRHKPMAFPMSDAVTSLVGQETTDPKGAPWVSPSHAPPGLRELRWTEQHPDLLLPYEGKWIGIKGTSIRKHGDSFEEVHDALSAEGISKALILFVRPSSPATYDIA